MGLAYIASVARIHQFHVDLFDFSRELHLNAQLLMEAECVGYPVYGISTYSETWGAAAALIDTIRSVEPDAFIVVGGYHASVAGQEILRDYPGVDLVIRNEGEEAFTQVLIAMSEGRRDFSGIRGVLWRSGRSEIVVNEPSSKIVDVKPAASSGAGLPVLPRVPWYFAHPDQASNKKTIAIVSSRGCPKRCTFCSIIVLSPTYRLRSIDSLMNEIRYRHEQERFGHIAFMDANFFVQVSRTVGFARALHRVNSQISWSGTATADQIAGMRTCFGNCAL